MVPALASEAAQTAQVGGHLGSWCEHYAKGGVE